MNKQEMLLTKLSEECSEVIKEAAKAQRFGLYDINPRQTLTNKEKIESEILDVIAVHHVLLTEGILSPIGEYKFIELVEERVKKVYKYLELSRELGTLQC